MWLLNLMKKKHKYKIGEVYKVELPVSKRTGTFKTHHYCTITKESGWKNKYGMPVNDDTLKLYYHETLEDAKNHVIVGWDAIRSLTDTRPIIDGDRDKNKVVNYVKLVPLERESSMWVL